MAEGLPEMLHDGAGSAAQIEVASNIFLPADLIFYGTIGVTTLAAAIGLFGWFTRRTGAAVRSVGNGVKSLTKRGE